MKPILLPSFTRDLVLGVVLCVVTLTAYWPAWNGQPIWDDDKHITNSELRSMGGLARIWTHLGATKQYYPLVHSVFWLAYHCWGDSPLGYHLLNILLHIFSALLLVRILRYLKMSGGAAWLAGAIFALHPVMVESVAWISELKNALSGVFFLAAALAYLMFDQERKRKYYAAAAALFVLGLLSKSVIATLPASLLVVSWWKQGRIRWKHDMVPLLPFFMAGIASGLFTVYVERAFIGAQGSEFSFSFIARCLIAGRAVWFYLGKLFWPADLIFIYPHWDINPALWRQYLFPAAALLCAAVLWTLRNRSRAPLAVFFCFTATLFPVLGFFNVYPFRYSFVADHFQYLAAIGPMVLAAAGMEWAVGSFNENRQRFFRPVFYVVLLLTLGGLTWRQSGMYADAETLYRTSIRKNPDCWMARNNLGVLLAKTGRTDEAIAHFRMVVQSRPDYDEAHYNFGNALLHTGRTNEAIAQFQKALEINPDYSEAHNNLGLQLAEIGRTDEAITHFQKASEIDPDNDQAHFNLGIALFQTGRLDGAIAHFRKALDIKPDDIEILNNLAVALVKKGQLTDAIMLLQRAVSSAKAAGRESLAASIAADLERLKR